MDRTGPLRRKENRAGGRMLGTASDSAVSSVGWNVSSGRLRRAQSCLTAPAALPLRPRVWAEDECEASASRERA